MAKKPTKTQEKVVKLKKLVRREDEVDTILFSFSGGRSSGMMGRILQLHPRYKDKKIITIYANTGKEREETLQFVKDCDTYFGWNTVWVEAVISQERGVGPKFKIVDFETATRITDKRSGLGDVMDKLDIPNPCKKHHCTRDSKVVPMTKYMTSLGYKKKDYVSAIGIRANEPKRLSFDENIIYPLFDFDVNELAVRQFWKKQEFDLQLDDYQGNCTLCFQKSPDKNKQHMYDLIQMGMEQEVLWWIEKEENSPNGYRFTRGYIPLRQMYEEVKAGDFKPIVDRFHGVDVLAEPLAYDPNIFNQKPRRSRCNSQDILQLL